MSNLKESVCKINQSLRSLVRASESEARAHANCLLKNLLHSNEAKTIFPELGKCPWKYLKKMNFWVDLKKQTNYFSVERISLSSVNSDSINSGATLSINQRFFNLNYKECAPEDSILDLNELKSIKF